ncbi:MAG: class I SAM-dependent methyltransferase [Planctomycetota bacterium]
MTQQVTMDQTKAEAFVGKVLADTTGMTVTLMAHLGDRLGIFKELAANGPATNDQLAGRAGINERYAREWLSAMACAGYLEYDPVSSQFTLPAEHAPVLAQEYGPFFFGGTHQMLVGMLGVLDKVERAFRDGGGVPQSAYHDHFWCGLERFTGAWFENLLVDAWIPAVPDVQAKLENGATVANVCSVADVGCGWGRALIKLAQTYPNSRYVGYDIFEPTIAEAAANSEKAGVSDRVSFRHLDVAEGLPEQYDVITTFDVIHDMVNPRGALQAIRQALKPDGTYLLLEINCSDKLEENFGPIGALFYSVSVLYCMSTSLAENGEGLGTCGLPPSKVRELCEEAGFSSVRQLPLENPFNILYEIKP